MNSRVLNYEAEACKAGSLSGQRQNLTRQVVVVLLLKVRLSHNILVFVVRAGLAGQVDQACPPEKEKERQRERERQIKK